MPGRPVGAIREGLDEVTAKIDGLGVQISELRNRLEPILRPEDVPGTAKNLHDVPSRSPIGEELDGLVGRIQACRGSVSEILERLDLG
jgi:hypothetical protein